MLTLRDFAISSIEVPILHETRTGTETQLHVLRGLSVRGSGASRTSCRVSAVQDVVLNGEVIRIDRAIRMAPK